jgi:hypothetical protein
MRYPRFRPFPRNLIANALVGAGTIRKVAAAGLFAGTIVFALAVATPAPAQVIVQIGSPPVPGFSNDYPWFNNVPQYQGNQSFRWFLANNPDIAQSLSQNPSRLYDSEWRSQFPALEEYLADHPYEWEALNGEYWSEGPAETQWGDYDDGQWRDAYWWHQNNPNWFYDNHLSWASLDSRWLAQDGAYDQQHQWHYGEWWYNQNPSWVTANHPNWLSHHRGWTNPTEQQNYRQKHAINEANRQPIPRNQDANSWQRANNQQRATDQRQANLQQQQTIRDDNQRQQRANRQATNENQQHESDRRQANLEQQQNLHQENVRQQQANREQLQAAHQENQQAVRQQHAQQQAMRQEQQVREPQSRPRQENSASQHRQETEHQPHGNGDNQSK